MAIRLAWRFCLTCSDDEDTAFGLYGMAASSPRVAPDFGSLKLFFMGAPLLVGGSPAPQSITARRGPRTNQVLGCLEPMLSSISTVHLKYTGGYPRPRLHGSSD